MTRLSLSTLVAGFGVHQELTRAKCFGFSCRVSYLSDRNDLTANPKRRFSHRSTHTSLETSMVLCFRGSKSNVAFCMSTSKLTCRIDLVSFCEIPGLQKWFRWDVLTRRLFLVALVRPASTCDLPYRSTAPELPPIQSSVLCAVQLPPFYGDKVGWPQTPRMMGDQTHATQRRSSSTKFSLMQALLIEFAAR